MQFPSHFFIHTGISACYTTGFVFISLGRKVKMTFLDSCSLYLLVTWKSRVLQRNFVTGKDGSETLLLPTGAHCTYVASYWPQTVITWKYSYPFTDLDRSIRLPDLTDSRYMKVGRLSAPRIARLYPYKIRWYTFFYKMIWSQENSAAGIEPATFRPAAQCLNQPRHGVPT